MIAHAPPDSPSHVDFGNIFLYDGHSATYLVDLLEPGAALALELEARADTLFASSVNDRGQLLAYAIDQQFLLTPVPLPASGLLFALASLLLGIRIRPRQIDGKSQRP